MKLLAWDFDGTLAHREGLWSGTLAEVAAQHAPELQATREHFRPFLSSGYRWHSPDQIFPVVSADDWWAELTPLFADAFRQLGAGTAQAEALAAKVRQQYINSAYWQVFPDTVPTLEQLSSLGWTHAILTNHVPEFHSLLDVLGLSPHFAFVVNSAETGFEKPHSGAFNAVLAKAKKVEAICMIGDSLNADIAGAHQVGWPAVLVRQHEAKTRWQATQLTALPSLLEEMRQAEAL